MSTATMGGFDAEQVNKQTRNLIEGSAVKNSERAQMIHQAAAEGWQLPVKLSRDGRLVDVSRAMRLAAREADPDADATPLTDAYGMRSPFLAASVAGDQYPSADESERIGTVDALMDRARDATGGRERAGPVDAGIVQAASPVQVDPVYVNIQQSSAPLLDFIQFEAQAGFQAKYNAIDTRSRPIGRITESDALDLSDNQYGDFGLATKTRDMGIYVDQVNLSDFTQRATDSLGEGALDVEETSTGERMAVHSRYTAGECLYGDPSVGKSDGSIQDSNATPGLARIAADRDAISSGDKLPDEPSHVVDKNGFSGSGDTPFLEDIKSELTDLVTNTGASYGDMQIVTSGEFFDTVENEANPVTRLGAFDEGIDFGARRINIKQGVPMDEVRAVGRSEHGQISYEGTGGAGNFDPEAGDVFIYDASTFRRRQLAPLSTLPLGRVGLADRAAMFEYSANIDKSLGAHIKYLSGYPVN